MDHRALGRSGLTVAPLCLGGNVFGWTADEAASFRVLDAFLDHGGNFIDTADVYSRWAPGHRGGESETVLGRWMAQRGNRDRVVIATKVGSDMGQGRKDLSRAWILQAVEDSLRRLQTDVIDLYQSHWDDADTPLEETLGAYDELVRAGKVRAIGASNYSGGRLDEALAISEREGLPRYETLQPEYNLYERQAYEGELEGVCRRHGLGVIPYFSLAAGFLTGKYRSEADFGKSPRGGGMAKYMNPRGMRVLAALDEVAAGLGATPTQVAIAWLVAHPGISAPIASATSPEQLADLIAGMQLDLDDAAIARLDEASSLSPTTNVMAAENAARA